MKRRNLLAAIAAVFCFVHCRGQCTNDTLQYMGSPSIAQQTDTLNDPYLPCFDYGCKAEYCHIWQLPPSFAGHLELFSATTVPISLNVQFWSDCHLLHLDTCVMVAQQNIMDWDTVLAFPPNSQVAVCNSVQPITIVIKPGPASDSLGPAIVDLDTLCGPFNSVEPLVPNIGKTVFEFDGVSWRQVDAMLPNRQYKVW